MLDAGLILIDRSLRVLGCDAGAMGLLNAKGIRQDLASAFPPAFLDYIRSSDARELSSTVARLRIGTSDYTCRAYVLESHLRFSAQPVIAIYLEIAPIVRNGIDEVATKYALTEREKEVLIGVSRGLRTKELAAFLNISPNTVKAFLRLVMIKMGATSKADIVSRIFQYDMNNQQSVRKASQSEKRLAS